MKFKQVTTAAAVALIALWASCVGAVGADAHTEHISSSPSTGSTVSEITSVSFTFSEPLIPEDSEVAVRTSNGITVATNAPVADSNAMSITATFSNGPLPDGRYRASYFIVAADGQPVESHINFIVEGSPVSPPALPDPPADEQVPSDQSPADGSALSTPSTQVTSTSTPSKSSTPTPRNDSTASTRAEFFTGAASAAVWLIPVAVLVLGVGVATFVLWRKRTARSPKSSEK